MEFRTAGQQRFYDLIEEKAKNMRNVSIVWVSLLAAAGISFLSGSSHGMVVAVVLGLLGIGLAYTNLSSRKEINQALTKAGADEVFYNQLIAPDTEEFENMPLLVTRDYVVAADERVVILKMEEISSVKAHKGSLFIVGKDGQTMEVLQASPKKKIIWTEKELHRACSAISSRIQ